MLNSLKLSEFSDRELLLNLQDVADEEGYATSDDVAGILGIDHDNPQHCVSARFIWLRLYGALDSDKIKDGENKGKVKWRLSGKGRAMANGQLAPQQERALENIDEDQMIPVVRTIAQRQRTGDETAGHLMRREWYHGTHSRRSGRR